MKKGDLNACGSFLLSNKVFGNFSVIHFQFFQSKKYMLWDHQLLSISPFSPADQNRYLSKLNPDAIACNELSHQDLYWLPVCF